MKRLVIAAILAALAACAQEAATAAASAIKQREIEEGKKMTTPACLRILAASWNRLPSADLESAC